MENPLCNFSRRVVKYSCCVAALRKSERTCAIFFISGGFYGRKTKRRAGHCPAREAHGEIRPAVHDLAAGGGAVQHRRPDLHRLGRGVSWQRRDERRVPADGAGAGSGCDDRRRRVQLCVDLLRQKPAGRCGLCRWQRCDAERVGWRARGGILRGVPDADFAAVRRDGGEPRLCEGVFHLHHHRHSDLRLRAGDQPDHPLGRQPAVCHGLHDGGRDRQLHPRPHRHLCAALGRDGRGCGDGGRAGHHGRDGRMVPLPYEGAAAGKGRFQAPREDPRGLPAAGTVQLSCADLARHRHGGDQQHARAVRCGQQVRRGHPADGPRHRHEGVSDHHFHHHRHVRGLHPHCGLQLRRGAIRPLPRDPVAADGGGIRARRARAAGHAAVPAAAHRAVRRGIGAL